MGLKAPDWIAISGVAATIIVGLISWIVSAALTRRTLDRKILGYRMEASPLMTTSLKSAGLKIEYKGEELPHPVLLTLEIFNLGNVAIINPPISIATVRGATYIIPVQVEDPPAGYEDLWDIRRSDADECEVSVAHINPGQVLKATFLMDEVPREMPCFRCALPDLVVKEVKPSELAKVSLEIAEATFPMLSAMRVASNIISKRTI